MPEHKQIWDGLIALLEQVVEVLGDEVLPLEDYAAILDAGLAGMGLDPGSPGFDQVMVCSLKRLRNSGVGRPLLWAPGTVCCRPGWLKRGFYLKKKRTSCRL
ncbi:MAG: hypothetical protein RQM92_09290 [Candidatus Syntrophopropionicum ammoniitolerans]